MVIAFGPVSPKTRYVTQSADLQFQTLYLKLPLSIKNKSRKHFKSRKKHMYNKNNCLFTKAAHYVVQNQPRNIREIWH